MKAIVVLSILLTAAFLITVATLVISNRWHKRHEVVNPEAQKEREELERLWRTS